MQLNKLIEHVSYESVHGSPAIQITDLCYDSRKAKPGCMFVCIRGTQSDGHDYVLDAVERGAVAVVVEKERIVCAAANRVLYTKTERICFDTLLHTYQAAILVVPRSRLALAELSAAFFGFPAKKLKMIGITGTKGKTTTAFFTTAILREAGYKTGMVGTVCLDDGKQVTSSEHTTPESYDLQKILFQMVENGCQCCVMEVSSQGIKMDRTAGIFFDIGVFLNIEPDHIGAAEHATFLEYLYCKSRLLQQCRVGIVNQDDVNTYKVLRGHTCQIETFSMREGIAGEADMVAGETCFYMEHGELYSRFRLRRGTRCMQLTVPLPGIFNVYNALAATLIASHFNVTEEQVKRALQHQTIPGRCENLHISDKYVFLIDYAHNEMSLRNLLLGLKQFKPGRLIVIFGCGGNRSGLRRNRMGETAGLFADITILTSDNPRWEDPERILDDIEEGIRDTGGSYVRITDRREAVRYAVSIAEENDIVVLAGKGHEDYQEIRGVRYPMTDRQLAKEAAGEQPKE